VVVDYHEPAPREKVIVGGKDHLVALSVREHPHVNLWHS
jgi:hypothetical protein